jgi:RNA recognition motif-containing protein
MPSYDYNAILQKIQTLRSQAYGEVIPDSQFPTLFFTFDSSQDNEKEGGGSHPKIISLDSLSQVLEEFAQFASLCPMTPSLWMHYAFDAGNTMMELSLGSASDEPRDKGEWEEAALQACNVRLDIIDAAVNEFPGCDLLWATLLQTLMDIYYNPAANRHGSGADGEQVALRIQSVIERALYWVGQGTHSYSRHVVAVWRMYAYFAYHRQLNGLTGDTSKDNAKLALAEVFALRSRTPLHGNDTLIQEAQEWIPRGQEIPIDVTFVAVKGYNSLRDAIDIGKQYSSKLYQRRYESHELSALSQMQADGLLTSSSSSMSHIDTKDEETLYSGNGGFNLGNVFVKYAKDLRGKDKQKRSSRHYNVGECDEDDVSVQMFERGISLCPTVDHIWIEYIDSVRQRFANKEPIKVDESVNLQSLVNRSVRNCPYSLRLFTLKMNIVAESQTTMGGAVVDDFDSDTITSIAKDACEGGFLPDLQQCLSVWLEACRVVRRALMSAAQGKLKYDDMDESKGKKDTYSNNGGKQDDEQDETDEGLDEEMLPYNDSEGIAYLIEDLRDCFEEASDYFRLHHSDWNIGRAKLWRERANVECNVILPIVVQDAYLLSKGLHMVASKDSHASMGRIRGSTKELLVGERCFESAFRLHPLYVEAWTEYIPFLTNSDIIKQSGAFVGVRKARTLIQRVIRNAALDSPPASLEYMCNYFVTFEEMYGSAESLLKASHFVKEKLRKVQMHTKENTESLTSLQHQPNNFNGKRKYFDEDSTEDDVKRQKMMDVELSESVAEEKPKNLKIPKESVDTVLIGKLSYPAHPFTIRVSNLSPSTEDLDLVDAFISCGKIVHARILREKPHNHQDHHDPRKLKSKGIGLVQFEEKESVLKALELNEAIGLNKRLLQVGRSHIPAVSSLVPPGMQRVNNKKEKQNKKQKSGVENKGTENLEHVGAKEDEKGKGQKNGDANSGLISSLSVLSFQPRGITRKKKIQIEL